MATAYNPMSGNSFVNAVGSTATTPVVAAPPAVGTPFGQAGGNTGPITSTKPPATTPQQAAADLAALTKQLQTIAPATIAANNAATAANDATNTSVVNLTNAITAGVDPTTVSVSNAFTALGVSGYTSTNTSATTADPMMQLYLDQQNAARVDAFKLLQDTFTAYGLIDPKLGANDPFLVTLTNLMKGYTDPVTGKITQVGPNEAALLLKQTDAYKNRFKGNQDRLAAGLNVLTEGEYIAMENQYANLFTQYGVSNFANRTEFASLIGKDISNVELNSRLDLAVNQVANASPDIKAQLRAYYPGITDADLTAYFLKPEETLPMLQQKVTSAQIGAAATEQGLAAPTLTRAEELAKLGVDQTGARTGYAKVAAVLPETSKLSQIYGETGIKYGQNQAEQEFLQNNQDVARQRRQLAQLEQGSFSGRSGIAGASVSAGYSGSLGKSIQGSF
jgi:hypothetical protein